MHYQFIMQSLCIFSRDRRIRQSVELKRKCRKPSQEYPAAVSPTLNKWKESKGKPLSLSSRVFMTPEHTMTNHKMHLGWSFLWGVFPQETKIQDCVGIVSCAVCFPQKHCNQYYQMYFKTRMWLSKIAQLKLMKECWESSRNIKCISKSGVDKDLYLPLFFTLFEHLAFNLTFVHSLRSHLSML